MTDLVAIAAQLRTIADQLDPPVVALPFPRQGISLPLGDITSKTATDQAWILDQIVALGNGHPMWLRTDWWPGDAGFQALAPMVKARPSLTLLPILNYDPASRPSVTAYASQAAQLAALYPYVNLLNEPNLGGWTPADAAAYTKAAYAAIGGKAKVVGPSCGFNGNSHGQTPAGVLAWNQAYAAAGGKQDFGGATVYGDAQYADPAWNGWSVVPQIRTALGAARFLVLEGGWKVTGSTLTPYKRAQMTDAQYQTICVQTGLASTAADAFLCYSLLNDASPGGYGLLDNARAQRPAYSAFKLAAR